MTVAVRAGVFFCLLEVAVDYIHGGGLILGAKRGEICYRREEVNWEGEERMRYPKATLISDFK
jgi:hypothetical protein